LINMIKSFNVGVLASLAGLSQAAISADAVAAIQSCPALEQKTYSGYLSLTDTKKLHYVYVESLSATQATDPVLLWSNGGPGCSSLLGLFQENGPLKVDDRTATCGSNPYSWNGNANVLYIEAPAGVGFSLAGDRDHAQNDMSQSEDLFQGL